MNYEELEGALRAVNNNLITRNEMDFINHVRINKKLLRYVLIHFYFRF
jgi:hypothetical protein